MPTTCFNQDAAVAYNGNVSGCGGQLISPTRAKRLSGDPETDWGIVMNGYNCVDALNSNGFDVGIPHELL
jgi:hypothetical protein